MTKLEILYMQWEEGSLDDEGVKEFKQLLESNDNRAALYELFETSAIIQETLIEDQLSKQESAMTESKKPVLLVGQPAKSSIRLHSPLGRSLATTPKSKSSLSWLAVAALITLAIGLSTWYVHNNQDPENVSFAQVSAINGNAYVTIEGQRNKLAIGSEISPKHHIETDQTSQVTLTYADNTVVTIGRETECIFENSAPPASLASNANGKRVKLIHGQIEAQVTKQPEETPFIIATTDAQTVVLGTQLKVTRTTDQTRVDLYHGRVRFELIDGSDNIELESSQYATVESGILKGPFLPLAERTSSSDAYSFTLINTDSQSSVTGFNLIKNNAVISLKKTGLKDFNVRVNPPEDMERIRINAYFTPPSGQELRILKNHSEKYVPFSVFLDNFVSPDEKTKNGKGGYLAQKAQLGSYRIVIVPLDSSGKPLREAVTLNFKFIE